MTKEQIKNTVINIYAAINARDDTTLRRLFAADIIRHATGEIGRSCYQNDGEGVFSKSQNLFYN